MGKDMKENIEQAQWPIFFTEYVRRNEGRPTRLEVIGGNVEDDFWLECGVPLTGIDTDTQGRDAPHVEIMLGGEPGRQGEKHLTRNISRVRRVTPEVSEDGRDQGLEIEDVEGIKTILRFEARDA